MTGSVVTKPCKVAFVGAGFMAAEHMKAFSDLPGVELVGIHSRSRARAEKLTAAYGGVKVCDSIADLYAETKPDIVAVSVSVMSMNEVAKQVFEFPWVVLLEKPAGYDLKDAQDIADAAQRKSRQVFVALNRRGYSSTRTALAMLDKMNGARFIKVQDQEDIKGALVDGHPELVVKNWMYANSIHLIDYFRIFGRGDIVSVKPVVPWNPDRPSVVIAHIAFSSGDIGLYEAIWNGPAPWAVTVCTPQDRLELKPVEQLGVQLHGQRQTNPVVIEDRDVQYKAGLHFQAEQVVGAVRGEPHSHLVTVDDALHTMKLVAQIYGLDR